ncbi:FAD-dependent oxidoreductase [Helicobacter japonicus]|nr:FAD-dependent oxidoreductase [Helicobacter japonicus]
MEEDSEIVLVGGGVMSLTLAAMLKELQPSVHISIYEMFEDVALESSMCWNNAGTGHQAFCELNYTPKKEDGSIDITKAVNINQQYELSREFWAYCVRVGILKEPHTFLNSVPHLSFVADDIVPFLKQRYETLKTCPLFANMQYSEDREQIKQWAPLLLEGRDEKQNIAVTYMEEGTDINFGEIVHQFKEKLSQKDGFDVYLNHRVYDLNKEGNSWRLDILDKQSGERKQVKAKFVFLGAGGGSFLLLQKSGLS